MGKVTLRTDVPGPRSREIVASERQHLAPGLQAFAQWSGIAMASGTGSMLTDVDGNSYVDLIGGIGVNALGHCHPRHVEAIAAQARTLVVGSFTSEPRAALVNAVCDLAPPGLDRLQLYSSGAEAVESALRLARCATGRTELIGFRGAFHGKTAGAAALMGSPSRDTLGPLPPGATLVPYADCYRCPFQLRYPSCGLACADAARQAMKQRPAGSVAAVVVEPMQGTAGNVIPPRDFIPAIAAGAREIGALLVADEMITGFGRTGRPWGVDHSGVRPDLVAIGKGFGSGFPVSGVLARDAVARARPWSNPSGASSSYGGNALASAVALATVETIRDERLWENAERVGAAMLAELRRMQERHPIIGDVRGAGLLIGIELVKDRTTREPLDVTVTRHVYEQCLRRGLLAMTYTPHVRLQPALTIDVDTALEGLSVLDDVLGDLARGDEWR